MKKYILIIVLCVTTLALKAQDSTYYVGHSLINLNVPYQTWKLLDLNNIPNYYKHHINIGASLGINWSDSLFNQNPIWDYNTSMNVDRGSNHFIELQNPYQHIVVTEAVPLLNYPTDTTVKYASNFYNLAQTSNPNIKKYLYATWEGNVADGLTWRNGIEDLIPEWEEIADKSALETGSEVLIIPGNLAMIALFDTLQIRNIGSFNSISDFFFADGIHLNYNGNYLISCLMTAVIYHSNSEGLTYVAAGPYTNDSVILDPIARAEIQKIAKDVVCQYNRTGVPSNFCDSTLNDTSYVTTTTVLSDTFYFNDNSIPHDSIYLNDSTYTSAQIFFNNTIYQRDTIHLNFHFLIADIQTASITRNYFNASINIYPNPFTRNLFINFECQNQEKIKVEILNILGEIMISFEIDGEIGKNKIQIPDVNNLENGIYLICIKNKNQQLIKKITKYN